MHDAANQSVYFQTLFHEELFVWYQRFYPDRRKRVPSNIDAYLTHPLSLAVWLMDDGNGYRRYSALRISSYGFSESEHLLLRQCLAKNFGVSALLLRDTKGLQLYFPVREAEKVYEQIQAYIHPVMSYKFAHF